MFSRSIAINRVRQNYAMKLLKTVLLGLVIASSLFLAGCGSGEQHLKAMVDSFDEDFVEGINAYAEFNPQQQQEIIRLSNISSDWIKTQRLPILKSILERAENSISNDNAIDEETYSALFDFLGSPFSLAGSDSSMQILSNLAFSLDKVQISQVEAQLTKEINEKSKAAEAMTLAKGNKEITRALQFVFRDLGVYFNQGNRDYLKTVLASRHNNEKQIVAAERDWNAQLLAVLKTKKSDKQYFQNQLVTLWKKSDTLQRDYNYEEWQHNRQLMAKAISGIIASLNQTDKGKLASRLRDYIGLLEELSLS